ncbi:MAG: helix-hairpin-helix domain-containing protein [Bacteroidia bacterium]
MIIVLTSVVFSLNLKAQETKDEIISEIIEQYLENADEDIDFAELELDLKYFAENPLDLNEVEREELQRLRFLTELQINSILSYRQQFGLFMHIFELQAVRGIDRETWHYLRHFVSLKSEGEPQALRLRDFYRIGRHELMPRYTRILEQQRGYDPDDPKYLGSPDYLRFRYLYTLGTRVSYGITAEKDAGEEFFRGSQKSGFDYYSAHLFVQDVAGLDKIAVGDYQFQAGQGLIMASGLGFGKSPDVVNIARSARGLLPYRSANENQFLRGAAATGSFENLEATAFFSYKAVDGNLDATDTLDEEESKFASLNYSGYHRTPGEFADKDALQETVFGGNLIYRPNSGAAIGATALRTSYDLPLQPSGQPYDMFDFSGTQFSNFSVDYSWLYRNFYFFGEAGVDGNFTPGFLSGVLLSLSNHVDGAVAYRHYPKNFQALYGNSMKESGRVMNERGVYVATQIKLLPKVQLRAYADHYRFPWLRYRVDAPSHGNDYLVELSYTKRKHYEMYLRYRDETKQQNTPSESNSLNVLQDIRRRSLRYHFKIDVSKWWNFASRIELSRFDQEEAAPSNGFLCYQNVGYRIPRSRWTFRARYTFFDIEDFNARIYTFENDVLYAFSIPFFQHEGLRYYILTKYQMNRYISFWLRFARTRLYN